MNSAPFVFQSYAFDRASGILRLHYRFSGASEFEEILHFPASDRILSAAEEGALDRAFRVIFLLAGVSYYKAFAPETMTCEAFPLDPQTAKFVEDVYAHGLGEFAYRNGLDMTGRAKFDQPCLSGDAPVALSWDMDPHACIPIGGGKDSLLTFGLMKKTQTPLTLFAVGSCAGNVAAPIQAAFDRAGVPSVAVLRHLSPRLHEVNAQGALNGHVPITAIVSAIALAAAILYGWSSVVMSNERSANAGNLDRNGSDINHQFSKSFAFEDAFARYIEQHVTRSISYFSLLRPLSEASIARQFAKLKQWHDCFRSCNTAFKQELACRSKFWCCSCPKCRFVYLALAPFMSRSALIRIFGRDLLDDPQHISGYEELCGLGAHKPFECVGEVQESAALMHRLLSLRSWKDSRVVRALADRLPVPPGGFETFWDRLMAPDFLSPHRVPADLQPLLAL